MALKRILINATYQNAIRIAYTQGNNLTAFEVEHSSEENALRNIYKGKISAVNHSLECAFVDIGLERHGMLSFKRLLDSSDEVQQSSNNGTNNAANQLREGQQILVQVEKEPRGSKGATLTAQLSIAGRYVVLKPGRPIRSISRAVSENVRNQLDSVARKLKIPNGYGVIMRTSAHRTPSAQIQEEFDHLLGLWKEISKVQDNVKIVAPALVYKENNLIHRLFRDKFHSDISQVLIDDEDWYREARQHAKEFYPSFASKVKHYEGSRALFEQFRVEQKIASCYAREVSLPSGGSIVIDPSEALVSVDVNSGKTKSSESFSSTALQTNLEAAEELVRQLILRNIGGLIVVDFIDMEFGQVQKVEQRMAELLEQDRAATSFCPISELGLMEIQRQRMRRSVFDTDFEMCRNCGGMGLVSTPKSTAWQLLRRLDNILTNDRAVNVDLRVPHDVGMFLKNTEKESVAMLESKAGVQIRIFPTRSLEAVDTKITLYEGERNKAGTTTRHYRLNSQLDSEVQVNRNSDTQATPQEPLVKYTSFKPEDKSTKKSAKQKAKKKRKPSTTGWFGITRWIRSLFGLKTAKNQKKKLKQSNKRNSQKRRNSNKSQATTKNSSAVQKKRANQRSSAKTTGQKRSTPATKMNSQTQNSPERTKKRSPRSRPEANASKSSQANSVGKSKKPNSSGSSNTGAASTTDRAEKRNQAPSVQPEKSRQPNKEKSNRNSRTRTQTASNERKQNSERTTTEAETAHAIEQKAVDNSTSMRQSESHGGSPSPSSSATKPSSIAPDSPAEQSNENAAKPETRAKAQPSRNDKDPSAGIAAKVDQTQTPSTAATKGSNDSGSGEWASNDPRQKSKENREPQRATKQQTPEPIADSTPKESAQKQEKPPAQKLKLEPKKVEPQPTGDRAANDPRQVKEAV